MRRNKWSFEINASLEVVDAFASQIFRMVASEKNNELGFKVGLIIIEVCSNIVRHGYNKKDDEKIHIDLEYLDKSVLLTITDNAPPFNPLVARPPDLNDINSLEKGGMGIYLIKQFAQKIDYEFKDNQNILTILV